MTKNEIKLLPEELINKIAAGEVIERPSSIVKELVENAIDAGATSITVRLKNGGMDQVIVTDNGNGISDVPKAILRHATSKIATDDDLFDISTLGFRGEALASICSVAKVMIRTKTADSDAFEYLIDRGELVNSLPCAHDKGTSIIVQDLFYNTPARKKYLKSRDVERRHCQEVFTKLILSAPHVSFKLFHDDRELIFVPSGDDFIQRLAMLFDTSLAKALIPVNYQDEYFTISGVVAKPYFVRRDKDQQFVLVNNRAIKSRAVDKGVYAGFHSLIFLERHPVFVLSVTLDPRLTDVNVHPSKDIIRIEHELELEQAIQEAVITALKTDLIPQVEIETASPLSMSVNKKIRTADIETQTLLDKDSIDSNDLVDNSNNTSASNITDNINSSLNLYQSDLSSSDEITDYSSSKIVSDSFQEQSSTSDISKLHDFGILKILGQLDRLYILAHARNGLLLIDQHAAQERVLFEKFSTQLDNSKIPTQELLSSLFFTVSDRELEVYDKYKDDFSSLGFSIDKFGENELRVSSVPEIFRQVDVSFFLKLLADLDNLSSTLKQQDIYDKLASMSCRAAIKSGDELTIPQMYDLIRSMESCDSPFACPHGRPTIITITFEELEKKFKRRG